MSTVLKPSESKNFRIKLKKININKELYWNNRFILGKIPAYNLLEDPHLSQHVKSFSQKKIINPRSLANTTSFSQINTNKSTIPSKPSKTKALRELVAEYENCIAINNIDKYFSYIFLQCLERMTTEEKIYRLIAEIRIISAKRSKIQMVMHSICNREECIAEIKHKLTSKSIDRQEIEGYFIEALRKMRTLSMNVVKNITEWKEQLCSIDPTISLNPSIQYIFNNESYLKTMTSDLYFLEQSKLAEFFEFSSKNDPFLVHPSSLNSKIAKEKYVIPISSIHITLLRFCEYKLLEETMHFHPFLQDPSLKPKPSQNPLPKFIEIDENFIEKIQLYDKTIDPVFGSAVQALKNSLQYKFPMIFWISCTGLAILGVSKQLASGNALSILHLSTEISSYLIALTSLVGFIWNNIACKEIRIEIMPVIAVSGKLETDISIKSVLSVLGFRWKRIISRENETPLQIYYLRNPSTPKGCISMFEDSIKLSYIYKASSGYSLPKYSYLGAIALNHNCNLQTLTNLLEKVENTYIPPAFKIIGEGNTGNKEAYCKISISWSNFQISANAGYRFVHLFDMNIQEFYTIGHTGYVIPTEDENINIVIILAIPDMEYNIENIGKILKSMKSKINLNDICIPGFRIQDKCNGEEIDLSVNCGEGIPGLYFKEVCNTVVNQSFVFLLFHNKIDEIFEIPYFFAFVDASNFIKI